MPSLAEDVNVDELRRRARRRLVGAIVLALAAAVIVPMLLESEPKPLGEDVAVKIPPVDDGKFVNRLNDPAARSDKTAPARVPDSREPRPAPETGKDGKDARAEEAGKAGETARPKYDTRLTDKDTVAAETGTSPTSPAAVGSAAPATSAPPPSAAAPTSTPPAAVASAKPTPAASAPTSPPPAVAPPKPAPTPAVPPRQGGASVPSAAPPPAAAPAANGGGFAVQLAAFSDDKGANALAGRLKRAGYTAYTEPYKTSKGTLWRVRVGPYASRETAIAARDKLKAEGQNGIVAPAH